MLSRKRKQDMAKPVNEAARKTYKQPQNPHPPDQIERTSERVTCKKCTRTIKTDASSSMWKNFWEYECIEVKAHQHVGGVVYSQKYRTGKGAEEANKWVKDKAKYHNGAGEMLWSGDSRAPVTCTACRAIWNCGMARIDMNKKKPDPIPKCTGNRRNADEVIKSLKEYEKRLRKEKNGHVWTWPVEGVLACKKCGFYLVKNEAARITSYAHKPCDRTKFSNNWRGMVFIDDPNWWRPEAPTSEGRPGSSTDP